MKANASLDMSSTTALGDSRWQQSSHGVHSRLPACVSQASTTPRERLLLDDKTFSFLARPFRRSFFILFRPLSRVIRQRYCCCARAAREFLDICSERSLVGNARRQGSAGTLMLLEKENDIDNGTRKLEQNKASTSTARINPTRRTP